MTFTFKQSTGEFTGPNFQTVGYSGFGNGVNNPALESARDIGPIPTGSYIISAFFDDVSTPFHMGKGPLVCHLTPNQHAALGRSGFMIHSDNASLNHTASHGCVILARFAREHIQKSGDTDLVVIA